MQLQQDELSPVIFRHYWCSGSQQRFLWSLFIFVVVTLSCRTVWISALTPAAWSGILKDTLVIFQPGPNFLMLWCLSDSQEQRFFFFFKLGPVLSKNTAAGSGEKGCSAVSKDINYLWCPSRINVYKSS